MFCRLSEKGFCVRFKRKQHEIMNMLFRNRQKNYPIQCFNWLYFTRIPIKDSKRNGLYIAGTYSPKNYPKNQGFLLTPPFCFNTLRLCSHSHQAVIVTMQNKGQSGTCRVAKMAFYFACWALRWISPTCSGVFWSHHPSSAYTCYFHLCFKSSFCWWCVCFRHKGHSLQTL